MKKRYLKCDECESLIPYDSSFLFRKDIHVCPICDCFDDRYLSNEYMEEKDFFISLYEMMLEKIGKKDDIDSSLSISDIKDKCIKSYDSFAEKYYEEMVESCKKYQIDELSISSGPIAERMVDIISQYEKIYNTKIVETTKTELINLVAEQIKNIEYPSFNTCSASKLAMIPKDVLYAPYDRRAEMIQRWCDGMWKIFTNKCSLILEVLGLSPVEIDIPLFDKEQRKKNNKRLKYLKHSNNK